MMKQNTLFGIIAVIIVVGGLVAISLSMNSDSTNDMSNSNQASTADAVATDTVEIKSYDYAPETITVKKGTKVTWTNRDSVAHTVTTMDGAPDIIDSGLFKKDASFSYTFTKSGTYEYFCEPHPYMKGTVIVTD